jgi:mRNA interferase RelE/StbE/toxin YoeB
MSYKLAISIEADKKFKKLKKKAKKRLQIINKKVQEILQNPHHFKPLRGDMKGARRVHINKSFVLVYEIDEKKKLVKILDCDHHDKIYK